MIVQAHRSPLRLAIVGAALAILSAGCGSGEDQASQEEVGRPVSVIGLAESDPDRRSRLPGTVASWKSEQIGFEVAGRVLEVIEPETNIEGRVRDAEGNLLTQGTELAKLDETRYRLHVKSVEAEIETKRKQKESLTIEIEKVIPSQRDAAVADSRYAESELKRGKELDATRTISQSELDRLEANRDRATAAVAKIDAAQEAKRAEQASLDAQIEELEQTLADAERDVEDCTLRSPFPGQVADVQVIPGSYVERGEPVVTVQLMTPIKVEFEVSAATARTLNHSDQVAVYVPQPDGSALERIGSLYMISPTADPRTRTFTVTLLVPNEKVRRPVPETMQGKPVVRTRKVARLVNVSHEGQDALFVIAEALHQDSQGHYVWKILNRRVGMLHGDSSPVLKVEKVRVTPGDLTIPVIGFTFREVTIDAGQDLDPATDLVAGELELPPGASAPWQGETILLDRERWLLRPGDLVSVDLRGEALPRGFYVPVDAIMEKSGANYVFLAEAAEGGARARKIEVHPRERQGTLRRIEAAGEEPLTAGTQIVARGAAFIEDGQRINVAEETEVPR